MNSVVIYGDVSPNVIDGSSIWLVSVAEALSGVFDEVHLQLKGRLQNRTLMQSVDSIVNIHIHEPDISGVGAALDAREAAQAVQNLVKRYQSSAVVVRGFEAAYEFSLDESLVPILWPYVTDLPFPPHKLSNTNTQRLKHIADHSRRVFAQTEAARAYWEALVPQAAGKVLLIPPMIPDYAYVEQPESAGQSGKQLSIVYAGKLAREWKTLEMLELPSALARHGINASLDVVGAKFNRSKEQPGWVDQMRTALEDAHADSQSGITWHGALSREDSIRLIKKADLGFGWRTAELDSSLEVSTKALEYGAAGAAPIINETEDHQQLWGVDYPFFLRAEDTIEEVAEKIANSLQIVDSAKQSALSVSKSFSMHEAQRRFSTCFERAGVLNSPVGISEKAPCRVVVASHDLKFMGELMDFLTRNPSFDVRQDEWMTLHAHNEEQSRQLAEWADVVFCEWAGPSLAWYSNHLPSTTRLISRLHRFEINGPWMARVQWDQVEKMVFVSDWVRQQAVERFGLDINKTKVIPNAIDLLDFDRPKSKNARFTLGLVGMVPFLKRPDRALDVLEELIKVDGRYMLRIKGRMPWEYPHIWSDPVEKQLYLDFFERVAQNEVLKEHVAFDGFGADIASWYRAIGFILSSSEMESFHLAPAEGMASRAIPVFWEREGVCEVFGEHAKGWSRESRVKKVLQGRDLPTFEAMGESVRDFSEKWDSQSLMPEWEKLFKAS